ncbi:MAG: DUF2256 domain-containing protein [Gammaproteobacteria bacterium]|nr:DUF2256 domain-containing protein [Gammaproteobacteria bacterium]
MSHERSIFRGNKQSLPAKSCAVCGRPMTWGKSWARNWGSVKYCSERCRRDSKSAQVKK